jgi:hypothetical protein
MRLPVAHHIGHIAQRWRHASVVAAASPFRIAVLPARPWP